MYILNDGYIWLILSILFMYIEIMYPGLFFFLAFSVGCIAGAVLAFLSYSLFVQCVSSLMVTLVAFWIMRKYFAIALRSGGDVKTNFSALTGRDAIVTKEIHPTSSGQVKVRGELWPAKSDVQIDLGTSVHVVRLEGNHLIVKKR